MKYLFVFIFPAKLAVYYINCSFKCLSTKTYQFFKVFFALMNTNDVELTKFRIKSCLSLSLSSTD